MVTSNTLLEIIKIIAGGGLLGACGQGARAGLGLLKRKNRPVTDFSVLRLIINLLVGFALGGLGSSILIRTVVANLTLQSMFLLLLMGYAGGDVIERVVKLYANRSSEKMALPRASQVWGRGRISNKSRPFNGL